MISAIPCVYVIVNTVNGKQYIGSTHDFKRRVATHVSQLHRGVHGNRHLQRAWIKYGSESFRFGIVCAVDDVHCLLDCEQAWIDGLLPHYNIHSSARSCIGVKRSMETRGRIRLSKLGTKASKKTRLKMSVARKGMKFTNEHRTRISTAKTGYVTPLETRAKISASHKGMIVPKSVRDKMSLSHAGKPLSTEHSARIRAGLANRKLELAQKEI